MAIILLGREPKRRLGVELVEEGLSTPQFWLATSLVIYSVLGGLLQKSAFDHRRQGESARAIRLVRSATGLFVGARSIRYVRSSRHAL